MSAAHSFDRYLKFSIACALTLLLLVSGVNVLIDPFAIFSTPEITGINQRKTEFFKHIRLVKAYAIRRLQPDVLLLGNSRAELALDPMHPALNQISDRVYNAALSGGTIYESFRYLQHGHRFRPIKLAMLGLDKGMFESFTQPDFDEGILSVSADGRVNAVTFSTLIRTALSLETFAASMQTFFKQKSTAAREYRSNGMYRPENSDRSVEHEDGHHALFVKTLVKVGEAGDEQVLRTEPTRMYRYFRRLLDFCRAEKIDLRLYIHPVHAWAEENYAALAQRESVAQWKHEIVAILAEEAGTNGAPFPLWDFSGHNSVTSEAVPSRQDRAKRMQYYWEPLHYTQATGDLILDRMFDRRAGNREMPPDFGVRLTKDNVAQVIAQSHIQRQRYRELFFGDVVEIERIVKGSTK